MAVTFFSSALVFSPNSFGAATILLHSRNCVVFSTHGSSHRETSPVLYYIPPHSLIIPPYRYHQRYSSSMVGSRVEGRGPGRRLVMPPGAPIGPMGSSARHGARTSILDLDYSAKVRYSLSPHTLCFTLVVLLSLFREECHANGRG